MTDENPLIHESQRHLVGLRPQEVFSDVVQVTEDDDILRFVFFATRPDAGDKFSDPMVPVARVAISRRKFEGYLAAAIKEIDG